MTTINFSYTDILDNGTETNIDHTFQGDNAEYLPEIIQEFTTFLVHMGFTYLDSEVVETSEGYLIRKEQPRLPFVD